MTKTATVISKSGTFLKREPIQSTYLAKNAKVRLDYGSMLEYTHRIDLGTHSKLWLESPQLDNEIWYTYDDHFDYGDGVTDNLDIPYISQLDNPRHPYGTCNVTSVAMCLQYFGKDVSADQVLGWMNGRGLDRHVHDHLRQACIAFGVPDVFGVAVPFSKMKDHLADGKPVIYSGRFTRSGHIIVLRGYDKDKNAYYVNDPYGEYFSRGYKRNRRNARDTYGKNLRYSQKLLSRVSYGGSKAGWAHLVG